MEDDKGRNLIILAACLILLAASLRLYTEKHGRPGQIGYLDNIVSFTK